MLEIQKTLVNFIKEVTPSYTDCSANNTISGKEWGITNFDF